MRYTFENVRSAHTIEASFTAASTFADVPAGSYFYEAVMWAVENGVTTGWKQVGNAWYYFYDSGVMAANATTPDGHTVNASGARVK